MSTQAATPPVHDKPMSAFHYSTWANLGAARRALDTALREDLESFGLQREAELYYAIDLLDGLRGAIDLDLGGLPGWFDLTAYVHIVSPEGNRLRNRVTKALGEKVHRLPVPVPLWVRNIGQFTPHNNFLQWFIRSEADARSESRALLDVIRSDVLPFLVAHNSLPKLEQLMLQRHGDFRTGGKPFVLEPRSLREIETSDLDSRPANAYNLPIVYFLLGRGEDLQRALDLCLERYQASGPAGVEGYRAFTAELRKMFALRTAPRG